ncbi:Uncharacterised protein [Pluralibacter gergoviae]|nr:Uncharacterised protein [Pluralibacter gergoviae]
MNRFPLRGAIVFCGLLLVWQLLTLTGIPAFLLPSPPPPPPRCGTTAAIWRSTG